MKKIFIPFLFLFVILISFSFAETYTYKTFYDYKQNVFNCSAETKPVHTICNIAYNLPCIVGKGGLTTNILCGAFINITDEFSRLGSSIYAFDNPTGADAIYNFTFNMTLTFTDPTRYNLIQLKLGEKNEFDSPKSVYIYDQNNILLAYSLNYFDGCNYTNNNYTLSLEIPDQIYSKMYIKLQPKKCPTDSYRVDFKQINISYVNFSINEFPKLDLKINKSFLCLSPDQDQTCIDFSYNVSDPENDSVIFGFDTDLKPETILRSEYLEEPEGIFISNPITMINALNSDPNFINNFDNLSCSITENIVQQQANTKCINVIQANTPNNTQRVNSIMFNTFSRKSSGNYFGFYLPTQSRNLVNSFRFFLLSEFPNIYYNYSFYTDLSLFPLSNYGFMYNNTANTYKIVRNNQYITDISRSYIFPDGKSDLIYLGFENYINLEDNNNTEYFKLFVKRNNGNKTYIYTSSIFSVIPSSFNSLLYSFRISTDSNFSVSFWNSFKTESFQRTPNLNLNALPDKICYSDLGEYTTRIYYSDLPHASEYKQTDIYLSVYDNETNPLCFLGNGISITQFDFDNPEIIPDQDNFFNQILAFLRIFTILASQLGFLTTLRILVKVAILYLVYRLYVTFANLGIPATDIFRRIFIILFFLNFVLYLALLVDKTLFVLLSLLGILYISYEINAVGQGSQAQDTDKAFLYSTAFFSLLSFLYFGFLQLSFRARFGIPEFPDFVFKDLQSGLNTILGFFGYLFGLLFYTIPDIPVFINYIFIIFKLISIVSLIIIIRNFLIPTAKA